tara:strand:- start:1420 stop:1950 length:531 start_codon:yes stop_codon:yes gene_type:complete
MMINLKKDVNWSKVFGVVNSVNSMKRNQTLPLRTEIVEMSIDKYSGGKLKYIGDTADGMDFIGSDGLRYECKMQNTIFQPNTPHTAKVILKNHRGRDLGKPSKTFDKMILIDTGKRKVGVVNFEDLTMFNKDANVQCRVDKQSIIEIVADGVKPDDSYNNVNMENVIFEAIHNSLT